GDVRGWANRPAEGVLDPPRLAHQVVRAGDKGSERTAEALRKTDRDGVERPGDLGGRNTARDRGVQQAGPVEVDGELELTAGRDERPELVQRPDPAPPGHLGRV